MPRALGLVSPHLSDVTMSCSRLLAANPGSQVVTVFAGGPTEVNPLPEWDQLSEIFDPGDDVGAFRRNEEQSASMLLGATSHYLAHWADRYRDEVYGYPGPVGDAPLVNAIAIDLSYVFSEVPVDAWMMPLGFVHHDHELVATACLAAFAGLDGVELFAYQELPYAVEYPDWLGPLEARARMFGFELAPAELEYSEDLELKRRAIQCHRSQLGPLWQRIEVAVRAPEAAYHLVRAG